MDLGNSYGVENLCSASNHCPLCLCSRGRSSHGLRRHRSERCGLRAVGLRGVVLCVTAPRRSIPRSCSRCGAPCRCSSCRGSSRCGLLCCGLLLCAVFLRAAASCAMVPRAGVIRAGVLCAVVLRVVVSHSSHTDSDVTIELTYWAAYSGAAVTENNIREQTRFFAVSLFAHLSCRSFHDKATYLFWEG